MTQKDSFSVLVAAANTKQNGQDHVASHEGGVIDLPVLGIGLVE